MEVILLERVGHLGQMGDVVRVKPGYARNYLLPKRKALRATADNLKYFETQRVQLEADNLARADEARAVGDKLDGVSVILIRAAGEAGQLYGSVSARDVAQALEGAGFTVARGQVEIDRPIKSLGLFAVRVALHPEVAATVTVNVARSADEAEMQRLHGGMVTADMVEAAIEAADEEARRIADDDADDASSEAAADTDLAEADPAGDTDLADTGAEREDISTL